MCSETSGITIKSGSLKNNSDNYTWTVINDWLHDLNLVQER